MSRDTKPRNVILLLGIWLAILLLPSFARCQVNGVGDRPYMGWSSWSQEVVHGQGWLTEDQIKTQSDALHCSGLQDRGYSYINIDSGWQGSWDANGRPLPSSSRFPDGMAATVDYIHANGQKAGIYWIPGIQRPQAQANLPILGTPYHLQDILVTPWTAGNSFSYGQSNPFHLKIDFTKAGAQEYVNSLVNLFASWGVDFIKLDGVTPGSDHNNLVVDNRDEVQAWSQAIAQTGCPIWLTISWAVDHEYSDLWKQWANARRIDGDIECYCGDLVHWSAVALRFDHLATWQNDAGPNQGWNDLDSLEVGNAADGITNDERQTMMTLWAIANAPLYIGDDLTALDDFGLALLTNDLVIAVDQSGRPAIQITGGNQQIWAANNEDGTWTVALFNLGSGPATVTVNWSDLGFSGTARVQDLWKNADLGDFTDRFSADLHVHASRLLTVTKEGWPWGRGASKRRKYPRASTKRKRSALSEPREWRKSSGPPVALPLSAAVESDLPRYNFVGGRKPLE